MFDNEALKSLVQTPPSDAIIKMRDDFKAYIRHIFGIGTDEYLSVINTYENAQQHKLRKDHAIKNPWIIDELLRPIDNIWQAKGGDETYTWTGSDRTEDFTLKLQDVGGGLSLRDYMREIWQERFIADPNGLIYLEISVDGKSAKFTYKSITTIRAYETHGIKLDYLVFEPDLITPEGELSWVVDGQYYYRVLNDGKNITVTEQRINHFGFVPGIVCSPIMNTAKGYKVSLIDKQVDILNSYLVTNSVKEIYQFKHNYAIPWTFPVLCQTCNGTRQIDGHVCLTCKGSGYAISKDVGDIKVIPKPDGDVNYPTPPMGYVQPELGTCEENRKELDWKFDKMFHSLWGTTVEKSDNETATGRFIDTMPVYNKLNSIADIAQRVHRELAIIWGKFWFPQTFDDAKISYSRRYAIESPDALWMRYQTAREKGAPVMTLNYMLEQFYYAEFSANETMADLYVKMIYVEPYVHQSILEVDSLNVSEEIKKAKRYFSEWQQTLDFSKAATQDVKSLTTELMTFANTKVDVQLINNQNG